MRISTRFAEYIQVLQQYLASREVRFGRQEDIPPFADRLDSQASFHDEMASLVRSVIYGENMLVTRIELLDLLCLAVGDVESKGAEGEVHRAVRQLLIFVNGILLAMQGATFKNVEEDEGEEITPAYATLPTRSAGQEVVPKPESSVSRVLWKVGEAPLGYSPQSAPLETGRTTEEIALVSTALLDEMVSRHEEESAAKAPLVPFASSETPRPLPDPPRSSGRIPAQGREGETGSWRRFFAPVRRQRLVSRPALVVGCGAVTSLAILTFVPRHAVTRSSRPIAPLPVGSQATHMSGLAPEAGLPSQAAVLPTSSLVSGSAPLVSAQSLLALRPPRDQNVIDLPSDVAMQRLAFSPQPEYPLLAKMTDIQGQVALEVVISPQGSVESTLVLQGQGLLRGAAENAVRRWRFRPYLYAGKPTAVQTTVVVDFRR